MATADIPTRVGPHLAVNVVVWLVAAAVALWGAATGSAFLWFLCAFSVYRLISEVSVYRVKRLSVGVNRPETVATWLFVGRTAVTGAVILLAFAVAMIAHPAALVLVLGIAGFLFGAALLIVGVQFLVKLHRGSLSRSLG